MPGGLLPPTDALKVNLTRENLSLQPCVPPCSDFEKLWAAALQQASDLMLTRQMMVNRIIFVLHGIMNGNLARILLCKFPCFPVFTFWLNFAAMQMFRLTSNKRQSFERSAAMNGVWHDEL